MAEDDVTREHDATERQRRRFAERGEIPRSRELGMALCLAAALIGLSTWGPETARVLLGSTRRTLQHVAVGPSLWPASRLAAAVLRAVGMILAVAVGAGIAAGVLQQRGRMSIRPLRFNLGVLNPGPRLAQLFLPAAGIVNVALAVAKVLAVGVFCGLPLLHALPQLASHVPASLPAALGQIGRLLSSIAWRAVLAFVIVGAADYALSAWRLEKKMRMSTQEVRDEAKEDSGDPRLRGRRRKMAQELSRQRSLKQVPTATVVVVNPTHYAVALRYDAATMQAPRVVGKGADAWAERLRAIARRHRVPVITQPALTRALFRDVKVGHTIPEALYQAVAVVLAHVLRVGQAQGAG